MPSDRDILLGMGFDPARVECSLRTLNSRRYNNWFLIRRGHQSFGPQGTTACDGSYIREWRQTSARPHCCSWNEQTNAITDCGRRRGGSRSSTKFRSKWRGYRRCEYYTSRSEGIQLLRILHNDDFCNATILEHQVFGVRQDLQKHSPCKLPCRKKWPRPVWRINGGGKYRPR